MGPKDKEFWAVCVKCDPEGNPLPEFKTITPDEGVRCRLCPEAKSQELIPCCWRDSWIHRRCSYTVKSGRACASHFDVTNPFDKIIITRDDDLHVPEDHKGLQEVVPNTFSPKTPKITEKPGDVIDALESYWAYRHAWKGAGFCYGKGDHVPSTRMGPPSLSNALSLVATWETW